MKRLLSNSRHIKVLFRPFLLAVWLAFFGVIASRFTAQWGIAEDPVRAIAVVEKSKNYSISSKGIPSYQYEIVYDNHRAPYWTRGTLPIGSQFPVVYSRHNPTAYASGTRAPTRVETVGAFVFSPAVFILFVPIAYLAYFGIAGIRGWLRRRQGQFASFTE